MSKHKDIGSLHTQNQLELALRVSPYRAVSKPENQSNVILLERRFSSTSNQRNALNSILELADQLPRRLK